VNDLEWFIMLAQFAGTDSNLSRPFYCVDSIIRNLKNTKNVLEDENFLGTSTSLA
jgi:hypothetical protein